MYSTSSSECECDDEYCTCDAGYGNQGAYNRTPFYATMGNPLIYYAQVPPPSQRKRSREYRKDNQNCFAKAFKWYTQEHVPHQDLSRNRMEMNAFTAWLDSKYDEFLRDSQLDNMYHIKMKRTSIIEADRIPNNSCCEPRSKRFRVKSPWRRKHRINSKEAGDTNQKPNQSFHFILKPKELTRVASECQQSTTTMVSNVIPIKTTIKSQSYTLVTYEPEKTRSSDNKLNKSDELKPAVDEGTSRREPQNISCQCSMDKVEKTNAQSQYDSTDAEGSGKIICQMLPTTKICCCSFQPCKNLTLTPNNDVPKAVTTRVQAKVSDEYTANCQCSEEINSKADSQSQHETRLRKCESSFLNTQRSSEAVKTCFCEREEVLKVHNPIILSYPITFSNDSAQTSDHSIHLVFFLSCH